MFSLQCMVFLQKVKLFTVKTARCIKYFERDSLKWKQPACTLPGFKSWCVHACKEGNKYSHIYSIDMHTVVNSKYFSGVEFYELGNG